MFKAQILEKIKEITRKFDITPLLLHNIYVETIKGNITELNDIKIMMQEYITEEDEYNLGPIVLERLSEEISFVYKHLYEPLT